MRTTPKVVGGITQACRDEPASSTASLRRGRPVSTPEAAEMTKLLENIFRSVNIALVNELAMLCDRMGIDIWEVVDAAATKPFGFMRFDPGRGWVGTACRWTRSTWPGGAREFGCPTDFIELAGEVNQAMKSVESPFNSRARQAR